MDDNAFNLNALELILKPHIKYDILDKAYDGESACDMVIKQIDTNDSLYNLIFLDIDMPTMNGYEVLKYIREYLTP